MASKKSDFNVIVLSGKGACAKKNSLVTCQQEKKLMNLDIVRWESDLLQTGYELDICQFICSLSTQVQYSVASWVVASDVQPLTSPHFLLLRLNMWIVSFLLFSGSTEGLMNTLMLFHTTWLYLSQLANSISIQLTLHWMGVPLKFVLGTVIIFCTRPKKMLQKTVASIITLFSSASTLSSCRMLFAFVFQRQRISGLPAKSCWRMWVVFSVS